MFRLLDVRLDHPFYRGPGKAPNGGMGNRNF
jgi:hypothetical protein